MGGQRAGRVIEAGNRKRGPHANQCHVTILLLLELENIAPLFTSKTGAGRACVHAWLTLTCCLRMASNDEGRQKNREFIDSNQKTLVNGELNAVVEESIVLPNRLKNDVAGFP